MVEGEERDHISGATRDNIFPHDSKGCLEKSILSNIGTIRERMQAVYALLFHQILFPVCGVRRSGIRDDPRKAY